MIVIDNFLPYPNVVREWVLQQEFKSCEEITRDSGYPNTWPGKRTTVVNELDGSYANSVLSRIADLAVSYFGVSKNLTIRSSFQLTTEKDGDSWIHKDNDVHVAGILYLTPNAPIDSGTVLYSNPPHEPIDIIGNVYNRLVLYKADSFHKSNKYFGNDLRTGRLTQVFFIRSED